MYINKISKLLHFRYLSGNFLSSFRVFLKRAALFRNLFSFWFLQEDKNVLQELFLLCNPFSEHLQGCSLLVQKSFKLHFLFFLIFTYALFLTGCLLFVLYRQFELLHDHVGSASLCSGACHSKKSPLLTILQGLFIHSQLPVSFLWAKARILWSPTTTGIFLPLTDVVMKLHNKKRLAPCLKDSLLLCRTAFYSL